MEHELPELLKNEFVKKYKISLNYNRKNPISDEEKATLKDNLDRELRFWEIEEDSELEDFLFNSLAEIDYCLTEEELDSLPKPFWALILIMAFEVAAQSGGWVALSNQGHDRMKKIVEAYKAAGLTDVANGLLAATEAYTPDLEPGSEAFYAALSDAFAQHVEVDVGFDEDYEERMPKIISYARQAPVLAE